MSSTSPIVEEIQRKQQECERQHFTLETVFIHPVDLVSLIIDPRFVDSSYYTKSTPPSLGEIGKILGVKIVVSNNVPIHKLLYTVNMKGYRSFGGTGDFEKTDQQVNPSRRDE